MSVLPQLIEKGGLARTSGLAYSRYADDLAFSASDHRRGDEIDRLVGMVTDIAAEEQKAGLFDRCQADYPMLARTLAARRDNLKGTIAALEKRLSDLLCEPASL